MSDIRLVTQDQFLEFRPSNFEDVPVNVPQALVKTADGTTRMVDNVTSGRAILTVPSGTNHQYYIIIAMSNFTVTYNNKIETFVSNGSNVFVEIEETITTPIVIEGVLTRLYLTDNRITSIDAIDLSALTSLISTYNGLTSFSGTGLSALIELNLSYNGLTSFNVTGLSALTQLYLSYNQLTSIDVTGLSALTQLELSYNQLTSIDVTGLSALTQLELNSNELTSFNVTGLSALTYLNLDYNGLTSFSVTGLSALTYLYLNDNTQLTNVTLPTFPNVPTGIGGFRYLYLRNTALSNLTEINDVWSEIISALPVRNSSNPGKLTASNATLRTALTTALADKHWTVSAT